MISNDTGAVKQFPSDIVGSCTNKVYGPTIYKDIFMNDTVVCGCICAGVLMLTDYVTGVVKAIIEQRMNSAKMREGLAHKFSYVVVIFVAWFVEFESGRINLGFTPPLFVPVVVAISLIEITSILENCVEINPELADSRILEIFKNGKEAK